MTPKSPGWGIALPDTEILALTNTSVTEDKTAEGFIALLSFSTKSKGSLSTLVFIIARGILEPETAVA